MRWTVQQVAEALGVAAPAGLDAVAGLAGVSIDSRTIGAGELFIAIHGPRHDGHAHVAAAMERGAVAAVVACARLVDYPGHLRDKLYATEDTLAALQQLARTAGRNWRGMSRGSERRLAGVTGSTGKTTTKEILAALLATRFRVLKNEGNLNNEYGVPLTLLRLEEAHEAAVLELGMSHRGEIERLAKICEPEIGVVTNVAPVHLEFFKSLEEIAEAKRELIENLGGGPSAAFNEQEERRTDVRRQTAALTRRTPHGVAVLNADDARVMKFAEGFRGTVLTFGFGKEADFRAENLEDRGAEGISFDLVIAEEREEVSGGSEQQRRIDIRRDKAALTRRTPHGRIELPLAGRHNVMNALAALAAASVWGVGAEEAKRVFATLAPANMRGQVLKFEKGFTVINDCYNSNPVALASMVNMLASTDGYRRRILAAGEMLELGSESARMHREAGRLAASIGLEWIFGVQGMAEEFVIGAEAAGHANTRARFFETSDEAATFLREFIEPGDLLLVKGSRGVKMERVIDALAGKFKLAQPKLEH